MLLACKRIAFRVEDIVFLLSNKSYSRILEKFFRCMKLMKVEDILYPLRGKSILKRVGVVT